MSETTPPGPRHARTDEPEQATSSIPTLVPGEFTDDATQVLPVIPAQRGTPVSVPAPRRPYAEVRQPPAGVHPLAPVPPAPRRRVLPAVLAGVTVCLLAAGIAVGVGGAAGTDMTDQPSVSTTP